MDTERLQLPWTVERGGGEEPGSGERGGRPMLFKARESEGSGGQAEEHRGSAGRELPG